MINLLLNGLVQHVFLLQGYCLYILDIDEANEMCNWFAGGLLTV